jgi:hypothetical protein
VVARHDHGHDPGAFGGAEAGPEIVRILHAVEDEEERLLARVFGRGDPFEEILLAEARDARRSA